MAIRRSLQHVARSMNLSGIGLVCLYLGFMASDLVAQASTTRAIVANTNAPLRCVDFGPYVGTDANGNAFNPDTGPHPPPGLIDSLLDVVVAQGFSCIMNYGVLNGLDYVI